MKRYVLDHEGLDLEVEIDGSFGFYARPRLVVNGEVADERLGMFWSTTTLRTAEPRRLRVLLEANAWGMPQTPVLVDDDKRVAFTEAAS